MIHFRKRNKSKQDTHEQSPNITQSNNQAITVERGNLSNAVREEDIFAFLRQFGRNTNSFLLTYGGCEWFRSDEPPGLVAYIRNGHTCVVVGDPLCAPEDTLAILQAFSRHVGDRNRVALLLFSFSSCGGFWHYWHVAVKRKQQLRKEDEIAQTETTRIVDIIHLQPEHSRVILPCQTQVLNAHTLIFV